jgi:DNA-binding NtrC family response regulator
MQGNAEASAEERPLALVVDKDPAIRAVIRDVVEEAGVMTLGAGSGAEALEMLRGQTVRILIARTETPGVASLDLLRHALRLTPAPLVVAVMPESDPAAAREWIRLGAFEVLVAPVDEHAVRMVADRAVRQLRLLAELRALRRELQSREGYHRVVGRSAAMERVRDELQRLAGLATPVWLAGPAGTGKQLAARTIHTASERRDGRFLVVNCAGLGDEAWSQDGDGLFAQAEGGTLYLDGVDLLATRLHDRLADEVGRGLGRRVRLISGSTRDPVSAIEQGALPEGLTRELAGAVVQCPALCERAEDVALLARHFVAVISEINHLPPIQISAEALSILERYRWPGNVRELRNAVEHAVILATDGCIRPKDLPDRVREAELEPATAADTPGLSSRAFRDAKREVVHAFEQAYLSDLLERNGGNVTAASHQAGMLRSALQRLLRKHGFRSADFRKDRRPPGPGGSD